MSKQRTARPQPEPAVASHDEDVSLLLRRGEAALRDYDYDQARDAFNQAVTRSRGAPEPARALLGLLVDCLAADDEVVHLVPALSAAVQADPEVRLLASLAAARSGDLTLAARLVSTIEHPRTPEVYVPLCQAALAAGDLPRAAHYLDLLRAQHSQHGEIAALAAALGRQRQDERLPQEVQLLELIEAQDWEQAAPRARQILQRWPESDLARRLLREAETHRREQAARQLLGQAQAALCGGQRPRAIQLLTEALPLCDEPAPLRAEIDALLHSLREHEQAQRQQDRVDECVVALGRDEAAGLLLYLGLPAPLRARVAERRPGNALAWLDQLGAHAGSSPRATVDAVLALGQAQREPDLGAALHLIERHERVLEHLEDAARLREERSWQIAQRTLEVARGIVAQAEAARARGELEQALVLLGGGGLRALPAQEQHTAEVLRGQLREAIEVRQLGQRLEQLSRSGALLEAREALEQLLGRVPPSEQERLLLRRGELVEQVRRAFALEICAEQDAGGAGCVDVSVRDASQWMVLPDGDVLVAASYGPWVFLWAMVVTDSSVRLRARLHTPAPLLVHAIEIQGADLWLLGEHGELLQLRWPGLDVVRYYQRGVLAPERDKVSAVNLSADGTSVWITVEEEDVTEKLRVAELARPRVQRHLGERNTPMPIHDRQQPGMVCGREETMFLYDCRGGRCWERRLSGELTYHGAVIHPSGEGIFLLAGVPNESLSYCEVTAAGVVTPPQEIEESVEVYIWSLAVALEDRVALVCYHADEGGTELLALRAEQQGELRRAYRVGLPAGFQLIRGAGSQRTVGLYGRSDRLALVALGAAAPQFAEDVQDLPGWTHVTSTGACEFHGRVSPKMGSALMSELREFSPVDLMKEVQRRTAAENEPAELLALVETLFRAGLYVESSDLLEKAARRYPLDPETQVMWAHHLTLRRDWDGVRRRLEPLYPDGLCKLEFGAQHGLHLLGIALLVTGDGDKAAAVIGEAAKIPGQCKLESIREMLDPLPAGGIGPGASTSLRLRAAIAEADGLLGRAQWQAVQARLGSELAVWWSQEVQSLARLCRAYLEDPPQGGLERFRAGQAAATFMAAHGTRDILRHELPLREGRLSPAELDQIALRAENWLSAEALTAQGHARRG